MKELSQEIRNYLVENFDEQTINALMKIFINPCGMTFNILNKIINKDETNKMLDHFTLKGYLIKEYKLKCNNCGGVRKWNYFPPSPSLKEYYLATGGCSLEKCNNCKNENIIYKLPDNLEPIYKININCWMPLYEEWEMNNKSLKI